jgi:hypothetical protein
MDDAWGFPRRQVVLWWLPYPPDGPSDTSPSLAASRVPQDRDLEEALVASALPERGTVYDEPPDRMSLGKNFTFWALSSLPRRYL